MHKWRIIILFAAELRYNKTKNDTNVQVAHCPPPLLRIEWSYNQKNDNVKDLVSSSSLPRSCVIAKPKLTTTRKQHVVIILLFFTLNGATKRKEKMSMWKIGCHCIILLFTLNGTATKKKNTMKERKGEETYLQGPCLGLLVPSPHSWKPSLFQAPKVVETQSLQTKNLMQAHNLKLSLFLKQRG
jgi:hypothetical protein